ncbi:hypothetical protein QU38_00785, partial [Staphylococcus aureus]
RLGIVEEQEEHDALPVEIEGEVPEGEEQQPEAGRRGAEAGDHRPCLACARRARHGLIARAGRACAAVRAPDTAVAPAIGGLRWRCAMVIRRAGIRRVECLDGLRGLAALWVLFGRMVILTGVRLAVLIQP